MSTSTDKVHTDVGSSADASSSQAGPKRRPQRSRRRSRSPHKHDRLGAWLALLLCLALAAVPMLLYLDAPDALPTVESPTVAVAAETLRQRELLTSDAYSLEPLVPWKQGQPQYEPPPGIIWLQLAAFEASELSSPTDTRELIRNARYASVIAGLLAVAAVFWIGLSFGGLVTATLSAFVLIACPVFLFYARLAGPHVPLMAMSLLSLASAIWAIRPLKLPASLTRQGLGWGLSGLFMGMALLSGGLEALPIINAPLLLILILCPHRVSHLMGMVAAVIIAVLLATPWALYVHEQNPDIWQVWVAQLQPLYMRDWQQLGPIAGERFMHVLVMMLPWTPWLITGIMQPFSTSSAGARLRMFLGWVWFVAITLLLIMAPGHARVDELLMVLPAGAVLVGQVMRQFVDLSAEGRHTRMWRLLRWPHTFLMMLVSLALPTALHYQNRLLQEGWLEQPVVATMPTLYWAGMASALALLTLLSLRFVVGHYPGKATVCWAIWSVTAFSLLMIPVARGPWLQTPLQRDGIRIAAFAGAGDIYMLAESDAAAAAPAEEESDTEVLPTLMLYAQQALPPITHAQVQQAKTEPTQLFVLSPADITLGEGYMLQQVLDVSGMKLWRLLPAPAATVTIPDEPATPTTAPAISDPAPMAEEMPQAQLEDILPSWADLLAIPWLGDSNSDSNPQAPAQQTQRSEPAQNVNFTEQAGAAGAQTQPATPNP